MFMSYYIFAHLNKVTIRRSETVVEDLKMFMVSVSTYFIHLN